jgi:hypothetical protein
MPMKSQAMRGAMFSAAAGKSTLGIPQSVGARFVKEDTGGKLPDHVKPNPASHRNYAKGGPVNAMREAYSVLRTAKSLGKLSGG